MEDYIFVPITNPRDWILDGHLSYQSAEITIERLDHMPDCMIMTRSFSSVDIQNIIVWGKYWKIDYDNHNNAILLKCLSYCKADPSIKKWYQEHAARSFSFLVWINFDFWLPELCVFENKLSSQMTEAYVKQHMLYSWVIVVLKWCTGKEQYVIFLISGSQVLDTCAYKLRHDWFLALVMLNFQYVHQTNLT